MSHCNASGRNTDRIHDICMFTNLFKVSLLKQHISYVEVGQEVVWFYGDCSLIVSHGIDHVSHELMDHSSVGQQGCTLYNLSHQQTVYSISSVCTSI